MTIPLPPLLTSVRCLLSGGGGFSQLNVGQAEIDCEVSNSLGWPPGEREGRTRWPSQD